MRTKIKHFDIQSKDIYHASHRDTSINMILSLLCRRSNSSERHTSKTVKTAVPCNIKDSTMTELIKSSINTMNSTCLTLIFVLCSGFLQILKLSIFKQLLKYNIFTYYSNTKYTYLTVQFKNINFIIVLYLNNEMIKKNTYNISCKTFC